MTFYLLLLHSSLLCCPIPIKNKISVSLSSAGGRVVDVVDVGTVGVDVGGIVVAADHDDGLSGSHTRVGGLVAVTVAGVGSVRAAGVVVLVGDLGHSLTHEVVTSIADTTVGVPVIGRVFGAGDASAGDTDVADLTETAVLVPVLVEAAVGRNDGVASLSGAVVDLVHQTLSTNPVDAEVATGTHTGLGIGRVDLVDHTVDQDAVAVEEGESSAAAAGIVLCEVGLVGGTTLADVLDHDESGEALADTVDEVLVDAAGVDADALLHHGVILVPLGTLATDAVDGQVASLAVAVVGILVEDLVDAAAVAVCLDAGLYLDGGFAPGG